MDDAKRKQLIEELSQMPEPQVIPIERFFDGNDDLGSIGCNLLDHPGIDVFRDTLASVGRRLEVEAIYAQIAEVDPGWDSWPFADTVYVASTLSADAVRTALARLQPDEIDPAESYCCPRWLLERHASPILAVWWD